MKIQRVFFRGFGCLYDQEFVWDKGINLIEAANEAGKSTLLQGMLALMYGVKKEGLTRQVKVPWYDHYVPWENHTYGGEIDYTISDYPYRLIRSLTLSQEKSQLNDLQKGKEVTRDFPMDSRKERRFLETQIGISGDVFRRISFLTPTIMPGTGKSEKATEDRLLEKIKIFLTNQGDVSVDAAVKYLDRQIQEIGTHRSGNKKYGLTQARCQELEKELQQLKEDYATYGTCLEQLVLNKQQCTVLQEQYEQLENQREDFLRFQQQRIEKEQLEEQRRQLHMRLQQLEEEYRQRQQQLGHLQALDHTERQEVLSWCGKFQQLEAQSVSYSMENELNPKQTTKKIMKQTAQQTIGWVAGFVVSSLISIYFPLFVLCSLAFAGYFVYQYDQRRKEALRKEEQLQQQLKENESREHQMEELRRKIKGWLHQYVGEIPPFDIERWNTLIHSVFRQAQTAKEELQRLKATQSVVKEQLSMLDQSLLSLTQAIRCEEVDEEIYKERRRELDEKREEVARLEGRIEKMTETLSKRSNKEIEWGLLKQELQEMDRERRVYELAKQVLCEAAKEIQENVAPQLMPYAVKWARQLSDDRYQQLLVHSHQGMNLSVFVPETGENHPIEHLSKGTMDQMIMSLHLGLLQFYAQYGKVFLPLILDDFLVHFDEVRLRNALKILHTLSLKHQIFICTCHYRERQVMDEEGIDYHLVSMESPAQRIG